MTRKITVPGVTVDIFTIVSDAKKNAVVSMNHKDEIIVMFISAESGEFSARAMTAVQAQKFSKDLLAAHQAVRDDEKIAQMEKHFDE